MVQRKYKSQTGITVELRGWSSAWMIDVSSPFSLESGRLRGKWTWTMREILRRRSEGRVGQGLLKWADINDLNSSKDQRRSHSPP